MQFVPKSCFCASYNILWCCIKFQFLTKSIEMSSITYALFDIFKDIIIIIIVPGSLAKRVRSVVAVALHAGVEHYTWAPYQGCGFNPLTCHFICTYFIYLSGMCAFR